MRGFEHMSIERFVPLWQFFKIVKIQVETWLIDSLQVENKKSGSDNIQSVNFNLLRLTVQSWTCRESSIDCREIEVRELGIVILEFGMEILDRMMDGNRTGIFRWPDQGYDKKWKAGNRKSGDRSPYPPISTWLT